MSKTKIIRYKQKKAPKKTLSSEEVRAAVQRGMYAALKKEFPNGDPNFFIPTYTTNRDDAVAEVTKPYANNVWVYSACNAITTNLIQVPKVLDNVEDEQESEMLTEHPMLGLLENPNPMMDGPTFWENVLLDLLLPTSSTKGGQCFIVAESGVNRPTNLRRGDIPMELYPFSDEFFTPILDKSNGNQLIGWKYQVPNSASHINYSLDEVIRVFLVDPDNPLKGQAPIWAARKGLRQDAKATTLNENFFANNASLGGVLESEAELEKDVADEVRKAFEEKYAGEEMAGRTALLHSGIKYKQFTQSHQDMEFLDQRKYTREEILAVYRVPKFVVSVYEDINFATAKVADRGFWTNTLVPLDERVIRSINNQWIRHIEEGQLRLSSDYSKVPALQPDLTEKLDQAAKMFALQIPVEEINRRLELQLEIDDYDWLKTHLVNFNLIPAEDSLEGEEEEEEEPVTPSEDEEEEVEEEEDDQTSAIDAIINKIDSDIAEKNADDKLRERYVNDVLTPDEKKFRKLLGEYLTEQRNMILNNVDAWANAGKAIHKADEPSPNDFLKGKGKENKRLQKKTRPEYQRQAEREAVVLEAELGTSVEWTLNSPGMQKVLKERLKQITVINTTTFKIARKQISDAITISVEQGLSRSATAKLLKKEINKVYKGRINTVTIARTETASIHSQTRMDVYDQVGVKKLKWLTADDELVRGKGADFPHDVLHEVVRTRAKGFYNNEKIRFPHDPSASPSNTINCRCMVRSVKE